MYPRTHEPTPDKPAVVVVGSGETLTYSQLDERSTRLAGVLREAGLRKGDSVALLSDNNPRCFEVYWAALRSGLYITPVNHRLPPDEVSSVVHDCGARALIVSASTPDLAEIVLDRTPQVEVRLAFGGEVAEHRDYEEALAARSVAPLPERSPLPDRRVEPGVPPVGLFGSVRFGPDTIYLSPAPLYHPAPLRFCGLVQALGGTVHLMADFDPVGDVRSAARTPR